MTDLDVLLAAVLADPADDTPRLVWADAIEERDGPGDAARAEFVRVQVEWSQLSRRQDEFALADISHFDRDRATVTERQRVLRKREHELWGYLPRRDGVSQWFNSHLPGVAILLRSDNGTGLTHDYPWAIVRRGFIAEVRGPLAVLRGGEPCNGCSGGVTGWNSEYPCEECHGTGRTGGVLAEIVKRNPVERVETDREPVRYPDDSWRVDCWGDLGDYPHYVPLEILKLMSSEREPDRGRRIFPTQEAFREALSRALILEAREKASVPA